MMRHDAEHFLPREGDQKTDRCEGTEESLRAEDATLGTTGIMGLPGSKGEVKVVAGGAIGMVGLVTLGMLPDRGRERGAGSNFTILKTNS